MFYFTHRQSNGSPLSLELELGEFSVTPGGVRVWLQPPLTRLSRHYSWKAFPFAMNAMRTLIDVNADTDVLCKLADRLSLSVAETNMLSDKMEMVSRDTDKLVVWSYEIADQCPHREVADMLRRMSGMGARERDGYVSSFLD